jgi:beta-lactamase class A
MNLPSTDRLYHGVPDIPAGTAVYNKTGTTAMCCGDMGVLVAQRADGQRVPYIMVGVIERSRRTTSYTSWSRARGDVIREVSGITYRYLREQYGLV